MSKVKIVVQSIASMVKDRFHLYELSKEINRMLDIVDFDLDSSFDDIITTNGLKSAFKSFQMKFERFKRMASLDYWMKLEVEDTVAQESSKRYQKWVEENRDILNVVLGQLVALENPETCRYEVTAMIENLTNRTLLMSCSSHLKLNKCDGVNSLSMVRLERPHETCIRAQDQSLFKFTTIEEYGNDDHVAELMTGEVTLVVVGADGEIYMSEKKPPLIERIRRTERIYVRTTEQLKKTAEELRVKLGFKSIADLIEKLILDKVDELK